MTDIPRTAVVAFLLGCILIYTAEGSVPNTELSNFMTSLWQADVNRIDGSNIRVNIQSHTSTGTNSDHASADFFTYVDEQDYFTRPTYAAFLKLLDNYSRTVGHSEYVSSAETAEISNFLTALSRTKVMSLTKDFLHRQGFVGPSWSDMEHALKVLWFDNYSRHGHTVDSSGFEHVFVGETDSSHVIGLHNWIQFHLQEKAGHLNYLGYIYERTPVIGVHFQWYGKTKPLGSIMYGTSPEFDLAMFTTCFYARRNQECHFSLLGHAVTVKTYDISRNGSTHIGTAYVG